MELLRDPLMVQHLMKHEELIKTNFNVPPDETPAHFLLRQSNELFMNEDHKLTSVTMTYSIPTLITSMKTTCITCSQPLAIKKNINSLLFDDVLGTIKITIIIKHCKRCKHTYYPGFFESFSDKVRQYYVGWNNYKIFVSTNQSSFSRDLLDRLICMKQKCHTTFIGKAAAYNLHHMPDNTLDKRRLSEAYFKYTYLLYRLRYNLPLIITNGIDDTLKSEFPIMYECFQNKHRNHVCEIPGCKDCLVIDGNMKTHRKVCSGIGCHEDPIFKSKFCEKHAEGENIRRVENGQQELKDGEYHIEKIERKVTIYKRHLYQVKWKEYEERTLEPRENIPRILVELFERYSNIYSFQTF